MCQSTLYTPMNSAESIHSTNMPVAGEWVSAGEVVAVHNNPEDRDRGRGSAATKIGAVDIERALVASEHACVPVQEMDVWERRGRPEEVEETRPAEDESLDRLIVLESRQPIRETLDEATRAL
jgi:hypothetical protein